MGEVLTIELNHCHKIRDKEESGNHKGKTMREDNNMKFSTKRRHSLVLKIWRTPTSLHTCQGSPGRSFAESLYSTVLVT